MKPISADSHVVEAEEVFTGLVDRFGDDAPRVMYAGTEKDAIVIPAKGRRGVRPRMGWAGMRLRAGVPIERRHGHKPGVRRRRPAGRRRPAAPRPDRRGR